MNQQGDGWVFNQFEQSAAAVFIPVPTSLPPGRRNPPAKDDVLIVVSRHEAECIELALRVFMANWYNDEWLKAACAKAEVLLDVPVDKGNIDASIAQAALEEALDNSKK